MRQRRRRRDPVERAGQELRRRRRLPDRYVGRPTTAEPYRERMNDDIKTAADKVPQFEGQARRRGAGQRQAGLRRGELPHPADRPADHLAQRGRAADRRGGRRRRTTRRSRDRARPQGRGRRLHRLHRRRQRADRQEGRGSTSPASCCPTAASVVELKGLPGATPAQERAGRGFPRGHRGQPEDQDHRRRRGRLAAREGPAAVRGDAPGQRRTSTGSTLTTTRWRRAPTWLPSPPGGSGR